MEHIQEMTVSLADQAIAIEKRLEVEGLSQVILGQLATKVKASAIACHRLMT